MSAGRQPCQRRSSEPQPAHQQRPQQPAAEPQQQPPHDMVAAEVLIRHPRPPKGGRWSLRAILREAVRQLLPEPRPVRAYRPPSEYVVENGKVYWSDGMDEDYEPTLFTKVFAAATLGLYIGVPNIILILGVLSWWFVWARVTLGLIIGSYWLPLRPLFSRRVMNSYIFLAWRRYFKFSFVFDQSLDAYKDYVIAQFPHGAFPLGSLVGGTFMATEYPEYSCYALAANNSFLVPIWRHVHTWMGTMAATEHNFRRLLALGTCAGRKAAEEARAARLAARGSRDSSSDSGASSCDGGSECGDSSSGDGRGVCEREGGAASSKALLAAAAAGRASASGALGAEQQHAAAAAKRKTRLRKRNPQGVSVGVMVGGIAEMYLLRPDYEQIKLLERKGFVRMAVEHGADILPVYMFGVSKMMSFGPPWLMNAARKLRMSIGVLYGMWGTPIPNPAPLRMAVGVPVAVGPAMDRDDPRFDAHVEKVHAEVVEAVKRVYYKHRESYGWGDRPLVVM